MGAVKGKKGNGRATMSKKKVVDPGSAEAYYLVASARLHRAGERLAAGIKAHDAAWKKSDKTGYAFAGSLNHLADMIEQAADFIGK
jgi:hypothetical protein